MQRKILFLEDDELFGETIIEFLSENGFFVDLAVDGEEVLELSYKNSYHIYLFDVKVPKIDGFELLKSLRESGDSTPAIFLTSLKDVPSISKGFSSGCDDYLKKPIDLDELLIRLNAKIDFQNSKCIEVENFLFDIEINRLFKDGAEVDLAKKEALLLSTLLLNRKKTVLKEQIVEVLWSGEEYKENSLRVYINSLKKIFGKDSISNIRGVGYRFEK